MSDRYDQRLHNHTVSRVPSTPYTISLVFLLLATILFVLAGCGNTAQQPMQPIPKAATNTPATSDDDDGDTQSETATSDDDDGDTQSETATSDDDDGDTQSETATSNDGDGDTQSETATSDDDADEDSDNARDEDKEDMGATADALEETTTTAAADTEDNETPTTDDEETAEPTIDDTEDNETPTTDDKETAEPTTDDEDIAEPTSTAELTNTETTTPTMADIISTTRHFKGDADAPVTIIEFSDFQCPYCSRFAVETAPQIAEEYIEKGIVRLGYRHAAYHEGEAYLAAEASECAADQDYFWDYHDLLVARLAVEGKGDFPKEVLMQLASTLDMDTKMFNTCLESGKYSDLVAEETQESAMVYGISGTPAFLVNGSLVVGAQPYESFVQSIEEAQKGETDPALMTIEMEEQEEPMTADEFMQMIIEETRHFKGDADAPVTIIEFSDFQCPYCSRFTSETGVKIDEQYVDKGIVRFGYIHAAYHQGEAFTAAEASECAADQERFWDYHDLLIARMVVDGKSDFPPDVLKQYAEDLELDMAAFNTCLDEGTYADLVRQQTQMSSSLGVSGTPTFLINGKGIVGAQPFEVFQQIIEEEQQP